MRYMKFFIVLTVPLFCLVTVSRVYAGDLEEIRARGVLRHLGVPSANFVTGSGDGMDVELIRMFAEYLGLRYEYVKSGWGSVLGDLTGSVLKSDDGEVTITGETPIRGDLIANGFTVLPWRRRLVDFSRPTFPSQIWLIARSESTVRPIRSSGLIEEDIRATRKLLQNRTVLAMEKTCLDPSQYSMYESIANLKCLAGNQIVPAIMKGDAELTILDVPDALIALEKWGDKLKIIGPISPKQELAAAFRMDDPQLAAAFDAFLDRIHMDGRYMQLVHKYYPTAPRYFPDFFKGYKGARLM